eukprot:5492549-Pleurochrysis_carterae.AAC.1
MLRDAMWAPACVALACVPVNRPEMSIMRTACSSSSSAMPAAAAASRALSASRCARTRSSLCSRSTSVPSWPLPA